MFKVPHNFTPESLMEKKKNIRFLLSSQKKNLEDKKKKFITQEMEHQFI